MRFEVSERIRTSRSQEELLNALEKQFKKVAESAQRTGQTIEAKSIEASFGSINREDTTVVSMTKVDDGWLVVADVNYRPSIAFWVILIIGLFTWVLWLLPVAVYMIQKNSVRTAITECLQRLKNEFDQAAQVPALPATSNLDDLEKLGALKEKGLISDSEFDAKKKQILGL